MRAQDTFMRKIIISEILELIFDEEMSRRKKRKTSNFSPYKGWEVFVDRIEYVSALENVSP